MHYYPHHIGDFNAATRHLSRLERSIYRDLIELYYETESPISIDLERVCRRIMACSPEERSAARDVLNEFFSVGPDGWTHKRCEEELAKYRRMSSGGRAGAQQRWGKPSQEHGEANAPPIAPLSPPHDPPNGWPVGGRIATKNQEPITKNQEPKDLPPTVVVPQDKPGAPKSPQEEPKTLEQALQKAPGAPDCPHGEIVELYHECCPTLARVMVLSPKRQGLIRQRWREVWSDLKWDRAGGLVWFREFFESVNRSDFLTGRAKTDRPWQADLEWLMLPSNFVKVAEGRYNKGK
jgi:uncharacterized protein YdaU (DUF1376 family)